MVRRCDNYPENQVGFKKDVKRAFVTLIVRFHDLSSELVFLFLPMNGSEMDFHFK